MTNRFVLSTKIRNTSCYPTTPHRNKYCDWVIPISETENRLRKLGIVFECYDTEDTCDKKCLI